MRAVGFYGPREVSVQQAPDARIEPVTDVLVNIKSTYICGSDLLDHGSNRSPRQCGTA